MKVETAIRWKEEVEVEKEAPADAGVTAKMEDIIADRVTTIGAVDLVIEVKVDATPVIVVKDLLISEGEAQSDVLGARHRIQEVRMTCTEETRTVVPDIPDNDIDLDSGSKQNIDELAIVTSGVSLP